MMDLTHAKVEEVVSVNLNLNAISTRASPEDFKSPASDITKVGTGDKYVATSKISFPSLVMI
jgi:hypothetical protein